MLNIYNHFQISGKEGIMLSYKGRLSGDLIALLLQFVEAKFNEINVPAKVRKRVINILIESLQNVYHHTTASTAATEYDDDCTLVLSKGKDHYSVITGNYISAEDQQSLKERLDEINTLTSEQLGSKYREILNKKERDGRANRSGAGIGIIDMARRSGQKIDYDFHQVNDKIVFFGLEIKIMEN